MVHHNYGIAVVHQLFDGLVRFDPYLAPQPALAETWRIEANGLIYLFTLRKNARFHNGRAVTAEDVVFSLSRLLRIDPPSAITPHLLRIEGATAYRDHRANHVAGIQSMGDNILRIRLTEPHAPFLTALGMYQAMIVPRAAATADPEAFGRNPIGSGPFRFVSWEPNRSIRLERFPDYYGGKSLLDEILYRIYATEPHQRVLDEFSRGQLDEMPVFSNEVKVALAGRDDLQWFHRPSLRLFFYGINCRNPALKDSRLRRILSASIDRRQLVDAVFNGQFETANTILPPGMPGYQPPDRSLEEQLREAIAWQADPDASSPLIEIVSAYETPRVRAEMELVRAGWQKQGIRLKTKYIPDWKAFNDYIRSNAVQVYRYGWSADMPDPDSILYPLFASDSADNHMRFHNVDVDRLLTAARGTIDPVRRTELYRQAERLILEFAPLIPLFHLSVDRVYHAQVRDAQPSALGAHTMSLHKVWLDRSQ
jgi:ABC-type transport system substrate-binding protein